MKQFLKSGFIYQGNLFPTNTGSPQGGAISSLYANMTLDGLEQLIQDKGLQNVYSAKSGSVTIHLDIDKMILTAYCKL